MKWKTFRFAFLIILIINVKSTYSQVVINEFSASNVSGITDNTGKHADWIELYNAGTEVVDLGDYYLSDKIEDPTKWAFPSDAKINPSDYLLIFASGDDNSTSNELQTNFKLTQLKNEYIVFSDPNGSVLDAIQMVNPTQIDHSRGRLIDGDPNWGILINPSPSSANQNVRQEYADAPFFQQPAGFYPSTIQITLFAEANTTVRYTTNGTEPSLASAIYNNPITINGTTVIKAKAFSTQSSIPNSFTSVNTYFINEDHQLPVFSVSSNQVENLLTGDDDSPTNLTYLEYFENQELTFEMLGNTRGHGNDSWFLDQRGIRLYVKDDYGYAHKIDHQLFPTSDRTDFDVVILKASASDNFPNAANQWDRPSCHLRDAYVQQLSDINDLNLDERRYRRCVLYVNGEYWGIYELRERIDSDYTKYYHDQGEKWVDMLEYWGGLKARYGDSGDWNTLYNYMTSNDLSIPSNYDYVKSELDINSLIDYVILNTFVVNTDWLNWNTKWWRGRKGSGTGWRYCLWDMDNIFGLGQNYTGLPSTNWDSEPCDVEEVYGDINDPEIGHIEMLVALFENEAFVQQYANRYADLAATTFSCESMLGLLDEMVAEIEPEMPRQVARWGGDLQKWYDNLDSLRFQIENKCVVITNQVADCFEEEGITGPYNLLVDVFPPNSGQVQINTAIGTQYPWLTSYFGGIEINLTALPTSNFAFQNWVVANNVFAPDQLNVAISMSMETGDTIIANFVDLNCNVAVNITGVNSICTGESIVLDAGAGFASYSWSNDSNAQTTTVTSGGNYSVTVSDATGCFGMTNATILEYQPADLQIIGTLSICEGSTTELIASPGLVNYQWSTGVGTETVLINQGGTYSVSATDNHSCVSEASVFVNTLESLAPQIAGTTTICSGGIGLIELTNSYSDYLWNDNSTGANLIITDPGTYQVTVTDENGCTGTTLFTVAQGTNIPVDITGRTTVCAEGTPVILNVFGNYPNYQWSTGTDESSISVSQPGTYSVTVTNSAACTGTASMILTDLEIQSSNETVVLCYGEIYNGINYTADEQIFNSLSSFHGCDSTHLINVLVSPALQLSLFSSSACAGTGTGNITAEVSGGSGGWMYQWNTGGNQAGISEVLPGIYTLTVTDSDGCTATSNIALNTGTQISYASMVTGADCANNTDGSILLDILTGTPPYQVTWSNGATGTFLEGLTTGNYIFQITDANNCNLTGLVTVGGMVPINPDVITTTTTTNDGTATANTTGGQPPYNYQWSTGANSIFIENLTPGDYSVTVTDMNGCVGISDFTIHLPTATDENTILEALSIFPNPSDEAFVVSIILKDWEKIHLEILDLRGRKIKQQEAFGNELTFRLDLSDQPAGIYLVVLRIGEEIVFRKVMVGR